MKSSRIAYSSLGIVVGLLIYLYLNPIKNMIMTIKVREKTHTTVVSIFFSLNKSKHEPQEYDIWLQTFLQSVDSSLVMICDEQSLVKIRQYRKNLSLIKFYVYDNVWDLMWELENVRNVSYVDNYRNEQLKLDPESHIHNPDLYAIWNLKTFIMKFVSDENPFNSDYFIYTDAGAWRGRVYEDWPDEYFIHNLMKVQQNRILFSQVSSDTSNLERNGIIQGGFFSGNKQALDDLYKNYYSIHDRRLKDGHFVGKDQVVMNILALKEYNQTVLILKAWTLNCKMSNDPWFFYQYFLSHKDNFECKINKLSLVS